jgi:hypothetical protein
MTGGDPLPLPLWWLRFYKHVNTHASAYPIFSHPANFLVIPLDKPRSYSLSAYAGCGHYKKI